MEGIMKRRKQELGAAVAMLAFLTLAAHNPSRLEGKTMNTEKPSKTEIAVLGGGCFWCLEPIFSDLEGVENVEVGYAGGHTPDPTYKAVSSGGTGHAEVARITYRPDRITFRELLEVFFSVHDPTTLNRQGADVGTQYRSIVLYADEDQKNTAESVIRELEDAGVWEDPIVTEVVPLKDYYAAEDYHQEYFENNPNAPYCRFVIAPKVDKFRKAYKDKL